MGKYDDVNVGEKLPGTYCPVCGEMGLRKMIFDNVVWAVCPMIDGKPAVKELKDAHTAYKISARPVTAKAKPAAKVEPKQEGVEDG